MNIYITNLRSDIGNNELSELFAPFGEVKSAEIITDAFTGQSRGFGYVEMENEEEARKAIDTLDNTEVPLIITVQQAAEKREQRGSYKVGNSSVSGYRFRKY
jgi:RNA recognition motif-containing protein